MSSSRDSMARKVFEDIRDQPYRVSEFIDDQAANCALKGKQLLERLGSLGYAVRGRVAEMQWENTLLPKEIVSLYPADLLATHFFIEVEEDGAWRCLDPSWDRGLEIAGFPIATWDGKNCPGFTLGKVYEFEEQAKYLNLCNDSSYASEYFVKARVFLQATNAWLEKIRRRPQAGLTAQGE